jgi:endonuclease YncB( thermonuclease family)
MASAVIAGLGVPTGVHAAVVTGRVISVIDGDTLVIRTPGRDQRLDLAEIAAPVAAQPYGAAAKKALAALVQEQEIQVDLPEQGENVPVRRSVQHNGRNVSAELLRRGLAWVDRKNVSERRLFTFEAQARIAKIGLWKDANAIPPWEWQEGRRPLHYREADLTGLVVGDRRTKLYYSEACANPPVPADHRKLFVRPKEAERAGYRRERSCPKS